jgi:hypothetical protein
MGRRQDAETGFSLSPSVVARNHSTTDEGHENDSRKRLDVIRRVIMAFLLKIQSTLGQSRLQQNDGRAIKDVQESTCYIQCGLDESISPLLVCMGSDKNSSSLAG